MKMKRALMLFLLLSVLIVMTACQSVITDPMGAEEGTGSLRIENNLPGYNIYIDDTFITSSPTEIATVHDIAAGDHTVKLTKEDCQNVIETVTIYSGSTTTLVTYMMCGVDQLPPEKKDDDQDGIPNDRDGCYNPGCEVIDSQGCPIDSDNDGLTDCEDECPTRKGTPDRKGCPPEEDKDKDGITDDEDACHNPECALVDGQGCPLDSDNDGLNDCADACPHQYGERSATGCPAQEEIDTDGDGVPDDRDVCDNPGCSTVDMNGCPIDSDSDGLADCEDNCPNQSGPQDNNGCPQQGFCLGSAILSLLVFSGLFFHGRQS